MLKVYVAGLVYFNGCDEVEKQMFAPDGTEGEPPHYASLWIAANRIEENATQWWDESRHSRSIEGADYVEFRIPSPAEITFPDQGDPNGTCHDLENKLPKLKKKKNNGTEENIVVDPETAQTIVEVTIRGGDLTPRRYKQMGLVEWTIAHPPTLEITATLQDDPGESRTITLKPPAGGTATEVVFSNTHDLFADDDIPDDDHDLALFTKLNADLDGATLVSVAKKARGSVGQLKTDNEVVDLLRGVKLSGGDPPNCCGK